MSIFARLLTADRNTVYASSIRFSFVEEASQSRRRLSLVKSATSAT